ncbi:hypothetical protein NPIL_410921 [Nephila pilipes]|uniref:Uncharacterized protein n=1 Tax=Nephila pilipes TaxID=299642 RepID=A0A8X6J9L2_NEPPI|nr:hypothetical protein NPIL_410921 [Nephila pilipes]
MERASVHWQRAAGRPGVRMVLLTRCCCWRSVRKGSFASGIFTLAVYLVLLVTSVFHMHTATESTELLTLTVFCLICSFSCVVSSVVLLVGLCVIGQPTAPPALGGVRVRDNAPGTGGSSLLNPGRDRETLALGPVRHGPPLLSAQRVLRGVCHLSVPALPVRQRKSRTDAKLSAHPDGPVPAQCWAFPACPFRLLSGVPTERGSSAPSHRPIGHKFGVR